MAGPGRRPASHEPAPLGVPLRVPLLGVCLTAERGHQVQQRVLGGSSEERQQESHAKAGGTLTLWAKGRMTLSQPSRTSSAGLPLWGGASDRARAWAALALQPLLLPCHTQGQGMLRPNPGLLRARKEPQGPGPLAEDGLSGEGPHTAATLFPEMRRPAVRGDHSWPGGWATGSMTLNTECFR